MPSSATCGGRLGAKRPIQKHPSGQVTDEVAWTRTMLWGRREDSQEEWRQLQQSSETEGSLGGGGGGEGDRHPGAAIRPRSAQSGGEGDRWVHLGIYRTPPK